MSISSGGVALSTGPKRPGAFVWILAALPCTITACRVHPGVNHLLFASKANSGVDVDTMPPGVEVSLFGRSDIVQGPTFEEGKSAPVIVGFHRSRDAGDGWPYVGSVVATGPAAMAVAMMGIDAEDPAGPGEAICASKDDLEQMLRELSDLSNVSLSKLPRVDSRDKQMFVAGEAPPTWFSTTEGFGVGFELHGPISPLPQSTHVGYRRKEALIVPLSRSLNKNTDQAGGMLVHTPAVLNVTTLTRISDDHGSRPCHCRRHKCLRPRRVRHKRVQLFATGNAATRLAQTAGIQNAMLEGFVDDADCACKARTRREKGKSDESGEIETNPNP